MSSKLSDSILKWYQKNGRKSLPWKVKDPYKIWISEIMLQQTQVSTVIPYYLKFIKTYPNIKSLANANIDELMLLWSGLGYYRRIKNISLTSQVIAKEYNYKFPQNYDEILSLPGIGRTTASAISTFSGFSNQPILDGNVKRIIVRFFNLVSETKNYQLNKILWEKSVAITPLKNTSNFIQAMMDIGSLVCKISNPECDKCPLRSVGCAYDPINNHQKKVKKTIKVVDLNLVFIVNEKDQIYLEKIKTGMLWQGLYSSPIFTSESNKNKWISKNSISETNLFYTKTITHRVTNKKLQINTSFYFLKKDKKVSLSSKNWYNLSGIKVGTPKYQEKALDIYRSKYEKNNV